jgi:subtilase family serine protease
VEVTAECQGETTAGKPLIIVIALRSARGAEAGFRLPAPQPGWEILGGQTDWAGRLRPGEPVQMTVEAVPTDPAIRPLRGLLRVSGWAEVESILTPTPPGPSPAPPSAPESAVARAPGAPALTLTGRLAFRDDQGRTIGVRRARVRLWDDRTDASCGPSRDGCRELLAEGDTRDDGSFTLTGSGADDAPDDPSDPYIEATAESEAAVVQDGDGPASTYCLRSGVVAGATEGRVVDIGVLSPATAGACGRARPRSMPEDGAWQLLNDAWEAREFLRGFTLSNPGRDVPPVRIVWPSLEGSAYRPPAGSDEGAILMDAEDAWRAAVLLHAFGHHVLQHFGASPDLDYLNGRCDDPPGHCIWQPESGSIHWVEGWSDYFAEVLGRVLGKDESAGAALECDRDGGVCGRFGTPPPCTPGQACDLTEGYTAAILLAQHLADLGGPPGGSAITNAALGAGFAAQWEVLVGYDPDPRDGGHHHPVTIREFWDGYASRYPERANRLSEIFARNGIPGQPAADLRVESLNASATTVPAGGRLIVADTTVNAGAVSTGAVSLTRFVLSPDDAIAPDDTPLAGGRLIPGLGPAGGRSAGTTTVTVPSDLPPGIYHLGACGDAAATVFESDERNNCLASSVTIQIVALPDLVTTAVSDPPASAPPGATFPITDTTRNLDAAIAAESITRYYLSLDGLKDGGDTLLTGFRTVPALDPGAASAGTAQVTLPPSLAAGDYLVLVCADDTGIVTESDEAHNCAASTGRVTILLPDLVTQGVKGPPARIAPGRGFFVRIRVINSGGLAAASSFTRFYLSRDVTRDGGDLILAAAGSVPALAPGEVHTASVRLAVPVTAPLGAYFLLACADDGGTVVETNEDNNCAVTGGLDTATGNLAVVALADPPAIAPFGERLTLTDTVRNLGTAIARASTTRFYLSLDTQRDSGDILLDRGRVVPPLRPGSESAGSTDVTLGQAAGTYYLLACADDLQRIPESDETDNCTASAGRVTIDLPDLVATAVSDPPATLARGASFPVTDTVQNAGAVAAAASTTRFYLSTDAARDPADRLLEGARSVPALAAGGTHTGTAPVTVPAATPAGDYFLLACANDTRSVVESDLADDCLASVTRARVLAPDLAETAVAATPASLSIGERLTVTETTQNLGQDLAAASTTRFYLSPDDVKDGFDRRLDETRGVPSLQPAGSSPGTTVVTVPDSMTPGLYFLLACADDMAALDESDETNNCGATVGPVRVVGPDLVEPAVSDPPAYAGRGGTFSVTDTAANQGGAAAGASLTRFYLSLDGSRDPGDPLLDGSRGVPGLAPGATSQGTTGVTVPSTIPAGDYLLLACADHERVVPEEDETNNCRASTGRVTVTSPDLTLTSITDPPSGAAPGSGFAVSDTVTNSGPVPAGPSVARFYLSLDAQKDPADPLLTGSRSVGDLAPGATSTGSTTVTIPTSVAAGTYFLIACANDTGTLLESNSANNCRASAGRLTALLPDLVVTVVVDPPAFTRPGDALAATDTVRNGGSFAAAASTTRYFLSVDSTRGGGDVGLAVTRAVPMLAPGATSSGTVSVTVPAGTLTGAYFLLACADDNGAVPESDETNNCTASGAPVTVDLPDLAVRSVSEPPATAAQGSGFPVTDEVENSGPVGAASSVTRFYLSADSQRGAGDTLLGGSRPVPVLGAGTASNGTTDVIVPATTPPGDYFLLACADDLMAVAESDETNNCGASSGTVRALAADLVETAVTDPPVLGGPGSLFAVTETAQNLGAVTAPATLTRFYLSTDAVRGTGDRLLTGSRPVPTLGPGATSTGMVDVTVPANTPPGVYYLLACADDTGIIAENDETNNCVASAGQVTLSLPDLQVESISDPPALAARGEEFSPSATVRNLGPVDAASSVLRFYLSLDTLPGIGDILLAGSRPVPALGPGAGSAGATAVTVPAGTPPGDYYLLGCADDLAAVAESNETNNCSASTGLVTVALPDLAVSSVSDPPATASPGAVLAVTTMTENRGPVDADASVTRFYLSQNDLKDAGDRLLIGTASIPDLTPGGISSAPITLTIPATTAPGTYYLLACADDDMVVDESDDQSGPSNNCSASASTMQVQGPDLAEVSLDDPPVQAARGSAFSVSGTVRNLGAVSAPSSVTRFYLSTDALSGPGDALLAGTRPVPGLPAGASSTASTDLNVPSSLPSGTYYLLSCADDTAVVAETDEGNNCRAASGQLTVP